MKQMFLLLRRACNWSLCYTAFFACLHLRAMPWSESDVVWGMGLDTDALQSAAHGQVEDDLTKDDIWQVRGEQLFYYDPRRGVLGFRVCADGSMERLGAVLLPRYIRGTMYPVGERAVVLLGQRFGAKEQAVQLTVAQADPRMQRLADLSFPGRLRKSHMQGNLLRVVIQEGAWTSYSTINPVRLHTFDMTDPGNPRALESVNLTAGNGPGPLLIDALGVVACHTEEGKNVWKPGAEFVKQRHTRLRVYDHAGSGGTLAFRGEMLVPGCVEQSTWLRREGERIHVLHHASSSGSASDPSRTIFSTLTVGSAGLRRVATLDLLPGKTITQARFSDDRLYVFSDYGKTQACVVDLRPQTGPKLMGELPMQGGNPHVCPQGDRVLTVDVEEGIHVAVSLYDVSGPTPPKRLQHLRLGNGAKSWAMGTRYVEQVYHFPKQNTLMVPYVDKQRSNPATLAMQILDIERDRIEVRGVLPFMDWPVQASLVGERLIALAYDRLRVVDMRDRNQPKLTAMMEPVRMVDRVLPLGQGLVQLSASNPSFACYNPIQASVDVRNRTAKLVCTPRDDPDHPWAELKLPWGTINGAELVDERLHVVQLRAVPTEDDNDPVRVRTRGIYLVIDLRDLRRPQIEAQVELPPLDGIFHGTALRMERLPKGQVLWLTEPTAAIQSIFCRYGGGFYEPAANLMPEMRRWGNIRVDDDRWEGFGCSGLLAYSLDVAKSQAPQVLHAVGHKRSYDESGTGWYVSGRRAFATHSQFPTAEECPTWDTPREDLLLVLDFSNLSRLRIDRPVPCKGLVIGLQAQPDKTVVLHTLESGLRQSTPEEDKKLDQSSPHWVPFRVVRAYRWSDGSVQQVTELRQDPAPYGFVRSHGATIYSLGSDVDRFVPYSQRKPTQYRVERLQWSPEQGYVSLPSLPLPAMAAAGAMMQERLWVQTRSQIACYRLEASAATPEHTWALDALPVCALERAVLDGEILWIPRGPEPLARFRAERQP